MHDKFGTDNKGWYSNKVISTTILGKTIKKLIILALLTNFINWRLIEIKINNTVFKWSMAECNKVGFVL